jgi:molybdenum cofactor cytidylyltransferase
MLRPEATALVLLAAGRSSRFDGDKLAAPFLGKPLAFHVVTALERIDFAVRIAVVSNTALDFAAHGYQIAANPDPALGQARSIQIGVALSIAAGVDAVLVALADMPRVTAEQCRRLFDASAGADTLVASSDGVRPMPPALFGRGHFADLMTLDGDQGARVLLQSGRHVVADPQELVDIDTRADLDALRARLGPAATRAATRRSD